MSDPAAGPPPATVGSQDQAPFHVARSVPFLSRTEAIRDSLERSHALIFDSVLRLQRKAEQLGEAESTFRDFQFVPLQPGGGGPKGGHHNRQHQQPHHQLQQAPRKPPPTTFCVGLRQQLERTIRDVDNRLGAPVREEHAALQRALAQGDLLMPSCLRVEPFAIEDHLASVQAAATSPAVSAELNKLAQAMGGGHDAVGGGSGGWGGNEAKQLDDLHDVLMHSRRPPRIPIAALNEMGLGSLPNFTPEGPLEFQFPPSSSSSSSSSSSPSSSESSSSPSSSSETPSPSSCLSSSSSSSISPATTTLSPESAKSIITRRQPLLERASKARSGAQRYQDELRQITAKAAGKYLGTVKGFAAHLTGKADSWSAAHLVRTLQAVAGLPGLAPKEPGDVRDPFDGAAAAEMWAEVLTVNDDDTGDGIGGDDECGDGDDAFGSDTKRLRNLLRMLLCRAGLPAALSSSHTGLPGVGQENSKTVCVAGRKRKQPEHGVDDGANHLSSPPGESSAVSAAVVGADDAVVGDSDDRPAKRVKLGANGEDGECESSKGDSENATGGDGVSSEESQPKMDQDDDARQQMLRKVALLTRELLNPPLNLCDHACVPYNGPSSSNSGGGGGGVHNKPHQAPGQGADPLTALRGLGRSCWGDLPASPVLPGVDAAGSKVSTVPGTTTLTTTPSTASAEFPVRVVRDDGLVGGSKQRALVHTLTYLLEHPEASPGDGLEAEREYVYAGPVYGYAQIALAHTCSLLSRLGLRRQATLFCESWRPEHKRRGGGGNHHNDMGSAAGGDPLARMVVLDGSQGKQLDPQAVEHLHPLTRNAVGWGARVCELAPPNHLEEVQEAARRYVERRNAEHVAAGRTHMQTVLLPFGLDCEQFVDDLHRGVWTALPTPLRRGLPEYTRSTRLTRAEARARAEGRSLELSWVPTSCSFEGQQQQQTLEKNVDSAQDSDGGDGEEIPEAPAVWSDRYAAWERELAGTNNLRAASTADNLAPLLLRQGLSAPLALGTQPQRMWLVAGSGTLLHTFGRIWPRCHFMVVMVGKKIWPRQLGGLRCSLFVANESFQRPSHRLPPYPSVANYDAKLWQFVELYGRAGDWIWNVGRDAAPNEPQASLVACERRLLQLFPDTKP